MLYVFEDDEEDEANSSAEVKVFMAFLQEQTVCYKK
jgi:hypothetical protein